MRPARRPSGKVDPVRLRHLQALAALKADVELARLAATGQTRARLLAALEALGSPEPPLAGGGPEGRAGGSTALAQGQAASPRPTDAPDPAPDDAPIAPLDPAMVRARLAHAGWITAQRRELNARLATVMADWHRLQPAAARAFGRARVLERLAEAAITTRREASRD